MERRRVLYFDAQPPTGDLTERLRQDGWEIDHATAPAQLRTAVDRGEHLVGLVRVPAEPGEASPLETLARLCADIEWVAIVAAEAQHGAACQDFLARHALGFCTEPVDPLHLVHLLGHALRMAHMRRARRLANGPWDQEHAILGTSRAMRKALADIAKIGRVDAPVLITGESGTGKELAARAVHRASPRVGGPFIAVNCGALPADLIQSELFGHEKGSFTGASRQKIGRIETANGGTLFLDEIGDLPQSLQVNLLRFLQEQTIDRVGGTAAIEVDVRVIAATHVDLPAAVARGTFREDLYYRLNVLQVHLPPLRERIEDIELLASAFFEHFAHRHNQAVRGFSEEALRVMHSYEWPGNVRELINRVKRATIMSENRLITPADLGLERRRHGRPERTLEQARQEAERAVIERVLRACRSNITASASELGISRVTLYRLIEKHGLANAFSFSRR